MCPPGHPPAPLPDRIPLCPYATLLRYLGLHPTLRGPPFAFQAGGFHTRARLAAILRAAFSSSCGLNTHSFRIGGASERVRWASVIRAWGRLKADSYRRCVQIPDKYVFHAQLRTLKFADGSGSA